MIRLFVVLCFIVMFYFLPWLILLYLVSGVYDVSRNFKIDKDVVSRYFFGIGIGTFILSPINMLLDVISFPFLNKKIYKLEDFPDDYQAEINKVITSAIEDDVVTRIQEKSVCTSRAMYFFKWYGVNQDSIIDVSGFKEKYKYIKTIGVSVFNRQTFTPNHFGPFRATLRILYNINDITEVDSYINVCGVHNYWCKNKLFIFDDTLMHESLNEISEARYCLFIDILRPSLIPSLFNSIVYALGFLLLSQRVRLYKQWKVIQ